MGEETAGPKHIGRYELHGLLGQGGMGTVYKGRDPLVQRWVAVKTLLVRDAQQRSRFQREVQAAGGLNHPHITAVYDVGETGELAYIVMELVEGETLARRLTAPVPWREAINLLLPVAQALGYAHRQGVIHRDVKPANILISQDKRVKLTDFGVARLEAALRRITESGSTVGTPLYMAPEQLRNEVVDGRADLFSLGIVLFELIAGRHPFSGENLAQIVYRITQTEPVDLTPLGSLAPPALLQVIGRSLSKTPEPRFAQAEAMARVLQACLNQTWSPLSIVPPSSPGGNDVGPSPPIIEVVPSHVILSPAEQRLLLTAFRGYDRLFLERDLGGGYSGARVLLVTPVRSGRRLAQVVLKLDVPAQVEREWQAYKAYVERTLPPVTARIVEAPLYAEDGQLGLMHYTFAGGHGHTPPESLRHYYRHHSGEAVATILEQGVFRAFGPKWWQQRRTASLIIRRTYDRLLPVHLVIAHRELAETTLTPHQLIAGQTAAHTCGQLAVDQVVQLQDFAVEEIKPDQHELTLHALPPSGSATNPIRVRLVDGPAGGLPYTAGQVVPVLVGVVTATRYDLLRQLVAPLLPGQDLDQPQLKLEGHLLPNPLFDYEKLLDQRISAMTSIVHGDLNLENILVNPTSGLAWLIDFATTGEGHNLIDFMRLETQIITKLLPEAKLGPAAVVPLILALHQAEPAAERLPAELHKPLAVLVAIRGMVRVCLYNRDNWDEYYVGLVLTLLGALKFKELDASARTMALAAAATTRGLITTPPPAVVPTFTTPTHFSLLGWLRAKLAGAVGDRPERLTSRPIDQPTNFRESL